MDEKTWPAPQLVQVLAKVVGQTDPDKRWWHQCHAASLEVVQSGLHGSMARVARGSCLGVTGQHSWVVLGDPYAPTVILDPTIWSYQPDILWTICPAAEMSRYIPHGKGSIWEFGRPTTARESGEEVIALTPSEPLSDEARSFLDVCGKLGRRGWMELANSPVQGWPAAEIIAAMDDTPAVSAFVPIDILGMLTDRNPEGLYLYTAKEDERV
jgi:hypothetical protein